MVLLAVLLVSIAVGAFAFLRGEDARRRAAGAGPRPLRSIGEAVRVANGRPGGRALVLFAGDDAASLAALQAMSEDAAVVGLLEAPELVHAVLRSHGDERQVADVLFAKYAQRPLPPQGPACLLLDGAGQTIGASTEVGPLASWLGPWLSTAGPAPAPSEPGRSP